jgi:alkylation response protein AidB-like acyl-CoA dehydrogenase
MILTAALTEAEADPRTPVTRASADGDGWKLDGIKICVPAGQLAQKILVPATTANGDIGIFIVASDAAGVSMEALTNTSRQPEVALDLAGVYVAKSDLLGDLKRGSEILDWLLERATSALCSLALGVTEAAVELTAEYTKERKQFGQAIATFQAVGQRAADAFIDTEGVRLTAWQAAWRLAEGLEASKEVAVAKIWAAEAGQRVVHAAVHLHGGMGVDRDYPLHRHFVFAKSLELALGGSSAQLRRLGAILASEEAA